MIVRIAPDGVALEDPDDFHSLAVRTPLPPEALRTAVEAQRVGAVDPDDAHVWLDPAALRTAAGERGTDANWLAGLDAMLGYAAAHGWTDDHGRVRAHVIAPD